MRLCDGKTDRAYRVEEIRIAGRLGLRLEALGLTPRARVSVIGGRKRGSIMVKVRGTRLAIGRRIAEGIQVREETR